MAVQTIHANDVLRFIVVKQPAYIYSIIQGEIKPQSKIENGKLIKGKLVIKKVKYKTSYKEKKFIEMLDGGYLLPEVVSLYVTDFFSGIEGKNQPLWLWLFPIAGIAGGIYLAKRGGGGTMNYVAYATGLGVVGLLPLLATR